MIQIVNQYFVKFINSMNQQQTKDSVKKNKIQGALWGSVLGDVIGAFLQFDKDITNQKIKKAFTIPGGGKHFLQPGQPTDDSQLNYAVCKALIRGKKTLNLNHIAEQMANWFLSKPIDVGNTIRNSVPKACNMKVHQAHLMRKGSKEKSKDSQSNGTLMALIGLALWCHNFSSFELILAVKEFTILIHPNQMVILTNCAYTLMVKFFIENQTYQNEKSSFQFMKHCLYQQKHLFNQKNFNQFEGWLNLIEKSFENFGILQKQLPVTKVSGWVRIAFSYSVYFAVKENDYKTAIKYLISAKGDTDTNACIAGGLLGAKLGLEKMKDMTDQIQKIRKWRPQKKPRPEWMVPGLVVQKISSFLNENSPNQLKLIGSEKQYEKGILLSK